MIPNQNDVKIYIKSLSTSCNKKATKILNVCSILGVFVYFFCFFVFNKFYLSISLKLMLLQGMEKKNSKFFF